MPNSRRLASDLYKPEARYVAGSQHHCKHPKTSGEHFAYHWRLGAMTDPWADRIRKSSYLAHGIGRHDGDSLSHADQARLVAPISFAAAA